MSRRAALKPIYGVPSCASAGVVESVVTVGNSGKSLHKLLANYYDLIEITATIIRKFFPATLVGSGIIADMNAKVELSPSLFVRVVWAQRNDKKKFDSSMLHLGQLKDIYLEYELDWTLDPVLKKVVWT